MFSFLFQPFNRFAYLLGNWPNNAPPGHYNRQYPPQGTPPQQPWGAQRPPGPPVMVSLAILLREPTSVTY